MSAKTDFQDIYRNWYHGDDQTLKDLLYKLAGEVYDAQQDPTYPGLTTITKSETLSEAHNREILLVTADSTLTLPATAEGFRFIIVNAGSDGTVAITVSPNASDKIMGSFTDGRVKVTMTGTDDKDLVNTKATAKKGDTLILVSDGSAGYYIEQATGIWTEESQTRLGIISEQSTVTDNTTLSAADSGKTYNIATDEKVFTLPAIAAANIGMKFRFRNTGADGAVALTISPNASDGINGSIANAAADSVAGGVVNKDLVNTKATANCGDWVEIEAVALTKWFITGGVGIWASEG